MSRSILAERVDAERVDPSSGDAIRSTVEVRSRRRTIGQGIALLALGAGVWLVVTAGDSSVIGGGLGPDDALSIERAALARILDGVVAQVEVEAISASGDQGAEFGAGAGPNGRPPAAPSLIGRDDSLPGGIDLGSGPMAPFGPSAGGGELVPGANMVDRDGREAASGPLPGITRSSTSGRPATTRTPTSTATTRSPTVATPAATTSTTTSTRPATTAPPTVTTGAVTTGAVTTGVATTGAVTTGVATSGVVTTGAVTTASTTATTAVVTTQPEPICLVTVSKVTQYRADHKASSPVIGQARPGTYDVLERHGVKWYRVAGGWLRDNKKVTPSGC
ncbi:MAG: hypothetical protein ACR2QO_09720 [Acidimicrobiales bacterium]